MTPLTVIGFTLDLQGKVPGESKFTFFLNFFFFFFFYQQDLKPTVYMMNGTFSQLKFISRPLFCIV